MRLKVSISFASANDVAVEVAQIVLLDDNFGSLLTLIRIGRLVFRNIRKVIIYLVPGGCLGEMVPGLMSTFLGFPTMLTNFCGSVVSFITDPVCSISLIWEKEEHDLMLQPPRKITEVNLVDWRFFFHAYAIIGLMIAGFEVLLFSLYFSSTAGLGPSDLAFTYGSSPTSYKNTTSCAYTECLGTASTTLFAVLVIMNVLGSLMTVKTNRRSFFQQAPWHSKTRNLWVYAAAFICFAVIPIAIYPSFFQSIFLTNAPLPMYYAAGFGLGVLIFIIDELRKFCVRNEMLYLHRIAW